MDQKHLLQLQKVIHQFPQAPYPFQSRVHNLKFHPDCYVKRDDELGFGISGSKIRKYRSLIPFFINSKIEEVIVIGSAYSNHVVSLSQLLIENNIPFTLFLRGDKSRSKQGNSLLTSLFAPDETIRWFSKEEWKDVEEKAKIYAESKNHRTLVLPEGGALLEALPGALTLPLDIIKNEAEQGVDFDHIFIDSGTGFMAAALILGMAWLKKTTIIHVMMMAGNEEHFLAKLKEYWMAMNLWLPQQFPFPENFCFHYPNLPFGKINSEVFDYIKQFVKREGFLIDPIYTAKLFMEGEKLVNTLKGNILFNHSGGSLNLMGFQSFLFPVSVKTRHTDKLSSD